MAVEVVKYEDIENIITDTPPITDRDIILDQIERGKLGLNVGFPIGKPKFGQAFQDLQPRRMILVGGETGCVLAGTKIKVRRIK